MAVTRSEGYQLDRLVVQRAPTIKADRMLPQSEVRQVIRYQRRAPATVQHMATNRKLPDTPLTAATLSTIPH